MAAVISAMLAASGVPDRAPAPPRPCNEHPDVKPPCFVVRGRLAYWNGTPSARISVAGSNRILGVSDGRALPGFEPMPRALRDRLTWDVELIGEYVFCPFTPERPNVMRLGCIQSAREVRAWKRGTRQSRVHDP